MENEKKYQVRLSDGSIVGVGTQDFCDQLMTHGFNGLIPKLEEIISPDASTQDGVVGEIPAKEVTHNANEEQPKEKITFFLEFFEEKSIVTRTQNGKVTRAVFSNEERKWFTILFDKLSEFFGA